jgi:hypothetical protein
MPRVVSLFSKVLAILNSFIFIVCYFWTLLHFSLINKCWKRELFMRRANAYDNIIRSFNWPELNTS